MDKDDALNNSALSKPNPLITCIAGDACILTKETVMIFLRILTQLTCVVFQRIT